MTRLSQIGIECHNDCLIARAMGAIPAGLVLLDPQARVAWLNAAAEQLLGLDSAECLGRPLEQALRDPQLAAFWADTLSADGDTAASVTLRWPRAAEVNVSTTRCTDTRGNFLGRTLLACDVTRDRAVQLELSQLVAKRFLDLTSGHMPPEPVAHLTFQELRILRLVGRGMGNDEIAESTSISSSTVRSHLKSLYRKLNLRSRAEAVSFAVRNHLV